MTDDNTLLTRRGALGVAGATIGGLALGSLGVSAQDNGNGNGNGDDDENGNGNGGNGGGGSARSYRVTVANLTGGQFFTPPAVALHRPSVEVFSVGDPANEPTRQIAENGNLTPLLKLVETSNDIRGAAVAMDDSGAPFPLVPSVDPGETGLPYFAELHVEADASARFLSFISMLIATNDGFTGLDTVPLPGQVNESRTYYANAYDAGTEENTELFADLVPPAQGLSGVSTDAPGTGQSNPDLAEGGVITPHPGIAGVGDLDPAVFGWRDPVALVQVERLS